MEYYKFIDEYTVEKYEGGFLVLDGKIYTNPTATTLKSAGYKTITKGEMPEYDVKTQYVLAHYKDGKTIKCTYDVVTLPEVSDDECDTE